MKHSAPSLAYASFALALVAILAFTAPASANEHVQEAYRITTDTADPADRLQAFDGVTIATFDLDGDGTKEIIAQNDNNNAYVFDGANGELLAELETNFPDEWEARELTGPSIGDVNGNGITDIILPNSAGWVTAFEARPAEDPNDVLTFHKLWETRMDPRDQDPDYLQNHPWAPFEGHPALDGSVFLADATGSGSDEVYLQLDDMPSLYAMNGNGEVRWWNNWSEGNSNPVVTDFSGDGRLEAMYPSDGGKMFFFDAKDHYPKCTFDATEHGPEPGSISVAPTVADLTSDGAKESIFGVRNATHDGNETEESNEEWYMEPTAHFFAVTSECEVLWQKTWDWANPHVHMHPVPVDVNGNGSLDVVFQDWNTIGHKPGNWQETGPSNLFAVEGGTGELLWRTETRTDWSNKNIALADISGDGEETLVVVETRGVNQGVAEFDLDGNIQSFHDLGQGWNVSRGPVIVDLTGDGRQEIIMPVFRTGDFCERELDVGCREGALFVYSTLGQQEASWSNAKLYNDAYDHEGEALQTPMPQAHIEEQDAPPGSLALHVTGEGTIQAVHVNVPGTEEWERLAPVQEDRYEGDLLFSPAPGDPVQTRVLFEDGQATFKTFQAEGDQTLLRILMEDQDGDPIQNGTLTITRDDAAVWSGNATMDGKVQIPLEPGVYTVEAAAPGFSDEEASVTVEPDTVNEHTIVMSTGFLLGLTWVGFLGGTGVIGLAVISGFLVMRKWSLFS